MFKVLQWLSIIQKMKYKSYNKIFKILLDLTPPQTYCSPNSVIQIELNSSSTDKSSLQPCPPSTQITFLTPNSQPLILGSQEYACVGVCSGTQIVSNSLQPHGLSPSRILCPWDFSSKNAVVGCQFLLQGIFLTQGLNWPFLHRQADSLSLGHLGSPYEYIETLSFYTSK